MRNDVGQAIWNFIFILFPLFDLILIILATFRLIRLVTKDHVMQFARDWFTYDSSGPLLTIHKLISCPWCFGLWAALVVVVAYFSTPFAWFPILVFAIGGIASLIQVSANLIGWSAEAAKQQAQ